MTADTELLVLLKRINPGFFSEEVPYRVLVRDEFKSEYGWGQANVDLAEWLHDKAEYVYKIDKAGVHYVKSTGLYWMHFHGCYAMNLENVAVEFKLIFG